MYDFIQITLKLVIIAAFIVIAVFASIKVWRADLDVRELLSPRKIVDRSTDKKTSWLPTREKGAIYQDNRIVGRVLEAKVDEQNATITFAEIYQSNKLNLGAEFEFQKWVIKFSSAESLTSLDSSVPQKGRTIVKALCKIVGNRGAL